MYARAVIARGRAEYITSLVSFRPATRLKSHFRDKRRAKYAAETEYWYKLRSQLTYRSSWIVFFSGKSIDTKKKKKRRRELFHSNSKSILDGRDIIVDFFLYFILNIFYIFLYCFYPR